MLLSYLLHGRYDRRGLLIDAGRRSQCPLSSYSVPGIQYPIYGWRHAININRDMDEIRSENSGTYFYETRAGLEQSESRHISNMWTRWKETG